MGDVGEAMLAADSGHPALDCRAGYLSRLPAYPAQQMVVVLAAAARAVDVLPACGAERVCVTVRCQRLQGPEDGGEPGAVTGRPQPDVQVLGVMKVPAAARACLIVARRAVMRTQRDFCRGAPVWGVPAGGLGCQQPVSRGPWLTT